MGQSETYGDTPLGMCTRNPRPPLVGTSSSQEYPQSKRPLLQYPFGLSRLKPQQLLGGQQQQQQQHQRQVHQPQIC
ncbi:unnamed protein product [Allacma fusca]|uniref:Uncharacterized protein n=1 Tax=Allacma fusca TaxID=39272 RepID=A0A8J2PQT6_9HEXA|nr:unnamed protein product [Allacma fusca]